MQVTRWGTLILLFVAAINISMTSSSVAQTNPQLERLQVDLWPEFDQPNMLVIYRGTLSAATLLPATLTLRLPAQVGEPHAVAYNDGSGNLLEASYSTATNANWLAVTLETPTPDFQLEFYDSLARAGERQNYTFAWPGDYSVEELSVLLLPPPGATDVQTEPALSPIQQGVGSASYVGTLGRLAAGQETRVTVSYLATETATGEAASRPTTPDKNNSLLFAGVTVAALALVIGGTVWYTRRPGRQPATRSQVQKRRATRKRRPPKTGAARDRSSSASYCTECGRPLRANNRFCGHCGTPVKEKKG